jgi:hypothetical protein
MNHLYQHIKSTTQADPEKPTMGAASGRNFNIYVFFSFCSNFEPLGGYRMSSPRRHFPIAYLFSTPRTRFDRSKTIEISTTRREKMYWKDHFKYLIWFRLVEAYRTIDWSEPFSHHAFIFDYSDIFRRLEAYRNFDYSKTESPSERYFRLLDIISISRS